MIRNLDDIQLTKKVSEGDQRALYQLYDKYSSAIYGVILRMCRDEDLAKDLLQCDRPKCRIFLFWGRSCQCFSRFS
ncbi:MAG: hypothetical protein AAGL29_14095, partial [Bacteroidota bacterium]